jgi:NodT family efflux transporter outer membrane factor (OMF) lipoprotein
MRYKAPLLTVLVGLTLSGCSLAPDPEPVQPVEVIPEAFSEAEEAGSYQPIQWWRAFGDATLDRLVDTVLVANLDLAEAVARVGEAQAQVGIAKADLFPSITGSGNVSRQDNPVNAGFGAIIGAILGGGLPGASAGGGEPGESPSRSVIRGYDLSVGFAYELDFWGRARNDRGAALADLRASAADFQAAQLGVLAEAITAYFDLVDLRNRIAVTEEIVGVLEEREVLSLIRYRRGLIGSFELYTVRQDLQSAQASVPQLRSQLGESRRRLALVSGRHLSDLEALLGPDSDPLVVADPIPPGLPADLLWQRPDVRAAGERLEAARLRVGARKAERLPGISLTGTLGLQSSSADGLFDISQWFSNLAAGLTAPLFLGGRLNANLSAAEARYAQQVAVYGRSVLTAVGEVESALLRYREERGRFQLLSAQLDQADASVSLQAERYRSGVAEYTDFLDALRIRLNVQSTLAASSRDVALARLAVHRALGGGWSPPDEEDRVAQQTEDEQPSIQEYPGS